MRKADYQLLTKVIRTRVLYARSMKENAITHDRLTYADSIIRELETVAHDFARGASVDRAQFLAACGFSMAAIGGGD